jgi:hypothetical protein
VAPPDTCLGAAREYQALLADDGFTDHFIHVMRTDRRLRDVRPARERPKKRALRRKRRKKR